MVTSEKRIKCFGGYKPRQTDSKFDLNNYENDCIRVYSFFLSLRDIFRKILPSQVDIIDGKPWALQKNLKRIMKESNSLNVTKGSITFYNSGFKVEDNAVLDKYQKDY